MPIVPGRFVVENKTGRLIEARVTSLANAAEVDEYSKVLGEVVQAFPASTRPILCADHRPVKIYPPSAADRLVELFQTMNQRLERVAILVARSNATLAMQLERIVREASWPHRRVFFEPPGAIAHLEQALDAKERERVAQFLAGFVPPPPSQR